jgi:transcription antitermination protein NusB
VTTRRAARRSALDILYQADVTGAEPEAVLREWIEAGREVDAFARELVTGVDAHLPEIDLVLAEHTEGWTVSRMAVLDRAILRIAVHELMHRSDVPPSVAISEAVEAATDLSAEGAARFVNGILGRIAAEMRPGTPPDAGGGVR